MSVIKHLSCQYRVRLQHRLSISSLQLDVIGVTADLMRLQIHTVGLNVFVLHGFAQTITTGLQFQSSDIPSLNERSLWWSLYIAVYYFDSKMLQIRYASKMQIRCILVHKWALWLLFFFFLPSFKRKNLFSSHYTIS